jgi:hypothetical protein
VPAGAHRRRSAGVVGGPRGAGDRSPPALVRGPRVRPGGDVRGARPANDAAAQPRADARRRLGGPADRRGPPPRRIPVPRAAVRRTVLPPDARGPRCRVRFLGRPLSPAHGPRGDAAPGRHRRWGRLPSFCAPADGCAGRGSRTERSPRALAHAVARCGGARWRILQLDFRHSRITNAGFDYIMRALVYAPHLRSLCIDVSYTGVHAADLHARFAVRSALAPRNVAAHGPAPVLLPRPEQFRSAHRRRRVRRRRPLGAVSRRGAGAPPRRVRRLPAALCVAQRRRFRPQRYHVWGTPSGRRRTGCARTWPFSPRPRRPCAAAR